MAGLLDFLSPVNANGAIDPHTLGLLNMMQAGAQASQPTHTPTSGLGALLGTLAAGGQGGLEAAQLGPKLGLLNQELRGKQIGNDLSQIDLNHYLALNGGRRALQTPVTGILSQGGGGTGSALGGDVAAAAPPPTGGAQPPQYGVLNGGGAGAPGGFALSPLGMLNEYSNLSSFPSGKEGAGAMLKLYEKSVPENSGVMTNGVIAPFTGAPDAKFTMANAESTGKTLGENNKNEVVAPGGALLRGPRTPGELAASLQGGGTAPTYVNPNPAMQIGLTTVKSGAQTAIDAAASNLGESQKSAQAAADLLPTLQRGKELIPQIFAGPAANVQVALTRLFNPDDPRLAATQEYLRTVGSQVGALARQVGGTQISDSDRKSAEKLAGGDFTISRQELESLVKAADRAANQTLTGHNSRVNQFADTLAATPEGKAAAPILRGTLSVNAAPVYRAPAQAAPAATAPSPAAAAAPQGMPQGARQAPDGNFYVPDPSRPGKYLQVVQ